MERIDTGSAAKRPKLCGDGGDKEEDRLSALPDDVLIHILLKLRNCAVCARTSVLSRRWRRLWAFLPELYFNGRTDPRLVFAAHEAPAIHHLFVIVKDATPDSVAAWLPSAARRLSGVLHFINMSLQGREAESEDRERGGDFFELPCFERATSIWINLGFLGLAVPPLSSGVYARLTSLSLSSIQLHGPCGLGDAVSSQRCPSLRNLFVRNVRGLGDLTIRSESLLHLELNNLLQKDDAPGVGDFTIHSGSLLQLEVKRVHGLQQLTVVTPALEVLVVSLCFSEALNPSQPFASISAPQLLSLGWKNAYDPTSFQLGKMARLQWLAPNLFFVYGDEQDYAAAENRYCRRLLQRFEFIHTLNLTLLYMPDIVDLQYMMEDMTRLPKITSLALEFMANGHSVGASSFHVLRMCTNVNKLVFTFFETPTDLKAKVVCSSGCICDQPSNWKTEELVLTCLEEVEIRGLSGIEHELALVKRLFSWATALKRMTVTCDQLMDESKAEELCNLLPSFSRPEVYMEFYVYRDFEKVLYVPGMRDPNVGMINSGND